MTTLRRMLNDEDFFNTVVRKSFNSVDTDGSGEIDFEEFSYLIRTLAEDGEIPEPSVEEIRKIFNILDLDQGGTIGMDEYKYIVMKILEMED